MKKIKIKMIRKFILKIVFLNIIYLCLGFISSGLLLAQYNLTPLEIIKKVDANLVSKTQKAKTKMIIYGKRNNRTIVSLGYSEGSDKSYTEFLSPKREKGIKMLKLNSRLWIYSPSTDRTIQLSGHMLRQSIMGSDLSYTDMMEDRKLAELYDVVILDEANIEGRKAWILELSAKVTDVSYVKRKMWVDQERFMPLREEFYAKSGQLLKKVNLGDFRKQGNRWYAGKMNFKDMLKSGKGTDFIVDQVEFDGKIPAFIFSKAKLRK